MWLYSMCSFLLLWIIATTDVKGECGNMKNRYLYCLEEYIRELSDASFTTNNCGSITTKATNCVDQMITSCNDNTEWTHVATLLNVTRIEIALASACQTHTDIKTTYSCLIQRSTELKDCILTESKRLSDIWTVFTEEQSFCLSMDAFGICSKRLIETHCGGVPNSDSLLELMEEYLPGDCYDITKPISYTCSDADVMARYSLCMDEFLKNVSSLEFEIVIAKKEQLCHESKIKTLQCSQELLQSCAGDQRYTFIHKLLNFNRTRYALRYACEHTWDIAAGTFCQNKHLVSDIQPCIARKAFTKQNAKESEDTTASPADTTDETPLWEKVCSDIDDRLSCIRSGMAKSCNETGIAYTDYISMFFPGECFKENDDTNKAASLFSVSTIMTLLGLSIYVILSAI